MVRNGVKRRRGLALQYFFGGALCLLAALNVLVGSAWYLSLGIALTGAIIILGRRRILRPGVTRTPNEIVCRYVPWYEGNAFTLDVLLPGMGVTFTVAGYAPGYPGWLRFGGIFLLAVTPLSVFATVRMWHRCFLRISPSTLTVQLAAPKDGPIVIRRELLESITPKIVPNGVSGQSLQTEIVYREAGSTTTRTVLIGLQLSVKPINLLNALAYWQDGHHDEPSELLDRVERILRGRARVAV